MAKSSVKTHNGEKLWRTHFHAMFCAKCWVGFGKHIVILTMLVAAIVLAFIGTYIKTVMTLLTIIRHLDIFNLRNKMVAPVTEIV